jgi:HEAT repeat protein
MDNHVYALIQQTQADDFEMQRQGAIELGSRDISAHRPEVIHALCHLLGSEHLNVREASEEALIKIGGRDVIEALLPRLKNPSTTVLNYAVEILSKIGNTGIDRIVTLLNSKDHDVRKFGCDILGNLRYADSVYDLIELLNDPHINVAIAAGEALGKLGNADAVPPLIRALHHPDTWMKCIAAEALGKIGDHQAIDALITVPLDEEPIVLYSVIKAIGNLHDQRVVPYIISILRSNPMFASSAVQAIESLATHQGETVYVELKTAGVTTSFIRLLSSENIDVLRSAIHLVGKLHLKEAVQPLKNLLRHDSSEIVTDAIAALVQIAEPGVATPIFEQVLAQITDTKVKDLLQQALDTLHKE